MYAQVSHFRAEGVTVAQASDDRLRSLSQEWSAWIDGATGWFFEPHATTCRIDGRGTPTVEPPAPPLRIDRISVDGRNLSLDPGSLVVVGAPRSPGAPRITLTGGCVFSKGIGNVIVEGIFGCTEYDGSLLGRTPLAIRRACMLLVTRSLEPLNSGSAIENRDRWRVTSIRTRDQAISFTPGTNKHAGSSGDPEVDLILARYRRPGAMGAA